MNYQKIYDQLIQKRKIDILIKNKYKNPGQVEEHHIIPLCCNGTNIKANIIALTPREHYIAHVLLERIYFQKFNDNKCTIKQYMKILHAAKCMINYTSTKQKRSKIHLHYNSKLYQALKIKHAKYLSTTRHGKNNPMYGHIVIRNVITNECKSISKNELNTIDKTIWKCGTYNASGKNNPAYNKIWYYNPITLQRLYLSKDANIPDGFIKGMGPRKNIKPNQNRIPIYNVNTNEMIFIQKNELIPDGWKIGMGTIWIKNYDMLISKKWPRNKPLPEGWIKGRIIKK